MDQFNLVRGKGFLEHMGIFEPNLGNVHAGFVFHFLDLEHNLEHNLEHKIRYTSLDSLSLLTEIELYNYLVRLLKGFINHRMPSLYIAQTFNSTDIILVQTQVVSLSCIRKSLWNVLPANDAIYRFQRITL